MASGKKNKLIKILALSGILYYLLLRTTKALIVSLKSYAIQNFDFGAKKIYMRLNFEAKNPIKVGVVIKRISGDVYVNGLLSGWISNDINFYLGANGTSVIPVVAELSIDGLTDAVLHTLESGEEHNTIAFNGTVETELAKIPIQVETTDEKFEV